MNSLLAVKMNETDTVYRMIHDYNYRKFGYDTTDPSKWSARDVFNLFVSFDNSVFGHTKFIIEDEKLFGIDTTSGFVAELLTKFNKTTAKVSLMEPVEICQTYTVCPSCDAYVRALKENVLPGSAPCCDPFDVTFCTTYWAEVIGGGGSGDNGGGYTGTGDGTGGATGGGSGGGGTGWYGGSDPCAGSTTPIPRLSTAAPVDGCGSGWTPVDGGSSNEMYLDANSNNNVDEDNNTVGGYDNTPYSQFNITTQTWPTIDNVIPKSDFVPLPDPHSNCLTLAKQQIAKKNYQISNYGDPGQTFQIYTTANGADIDQAKNGVSYLIYALQSGIPVIVGVDNRPGSPNPLTDNSTDHFVVIVGMGTESKGNFFRFYDSATNFPSKGTNDENKLYYNSTTRIITGKSQTGYATSQPDMHDYIVTMVRKSKPL